MALGNILITAIPTPAGVVSSKYRDGVDLGTDPPTDPQLGTPVVLSTTAVDLTLTVGSTGGTAPIAYELSRSTTSEVAGFTVIDANAVFTGGVYHVTGLTPNTQYWFRLAAVDAANRRSGYSTKTSITLAVTSPSGTARFLIPADTSARTFTGSGFPLNPAVGSGTATPVAGDIIELASGTHGPLTFKNFNFPLNNPVVIRGPQSGTAQAVIRRLSPFSGGFVVTMQNCVGWKFDGYQSTNSAKKYCGIKITYATNATIGNKDKPSAFLKCTAASNGGRVCKNFTIQYLEIDGGWAPSTPDSEAGSNLGGEGIGISTEDGDGSPTSSNPIFRHQGTYAGQWYENGKVNYNWVHHTQGEAIYFGSNYYNYSLPWRNAECAYNYIEECGGGTVEGKGWWSHNQNGYYNSMHHNISVNCGLTGQGPSSGGFLMLNGWGDVYANIVFRQGRKDIVGNVTTWRSKPHALQFSNYNGPKLDGTTDVYDSNYNLPSTFDCLVHDNLVVYTGAPGIANSPGSGIYSSRNISVNIPFKLKRYNNTIVGSTHYGIYDAVNPTGATCRNNILADNTSNTYGITLDSSNLIGTAANLFVNPSTTSISAADYRLKVAHLATGTIGVDISPTDITGATRSTGTADVGAYEK